MEAPTPSFIDQCLLSFHVQRAQITCHQPSLATSLPSSHGTQDSVCLSNFAIRGGLSMPLWWHIPHCIIGDCLYICLFCQLVNFLSVGQAPDLIQRHFSKRVTGISIFRINKWIYLINAFGFEICLKGTSLSHIFTNLTKLHIFIILDLCLWRWKKKNSTLFCTVSRTTKCK